MKKDRNTFFTETQMASTNMMPNMAPQMYQQPIMNQQMMTPPIQTSQASQSFYTGPSMPMQQVPNSAVIAITGTTPPQMQGNDIESRLSKIERQLHRLEAKITKLENGNPHFAIDTEEYNSSMYMI